MRGYNCDKAVMDGRTDGPSDKSTIISEWKNLSYYTSASNRYRNISSGKRACANHRLEKTLRMSIIGRMSKMLKKKRDVERREGSTKRPNARGKSLFFFFNKRGNSF